MDALAGDDRFMFSMVWPMSKNCVIRIGCSEKNRLREFMKRAKELPEKLRNLSSVNDDNSIEGDGIDGLSLEELEPFEGVDKFA